MWTGPESFSIWSLQTHDRPDRPDRTQFYPSDRGRLSRPGRLRSSGWRFHMIVPIVSTIFETTGMIGTIIWKLVFTNRIPHSQVTENSQIPGVCSGNAEVSIWSAQKHVGQRKRKYRIARTSSLTKNARTRSYCHVPVCYLIFPGACFHGL